MASRQEEKERRRQERLAAQQAAQRSDARKKRIQLALGALLTVALIAGIVVVVLAAGGDDDGDPEANSGGITAPAGVTLPPAEESDLDKAVAAAGCDLVHAKYEGAGHEEKEFKASDFQTNPPTSGTHFPEWYEDGIYEPGTVPDLGQLVHTLEHGRINVQYKKGSSKELVDQLTAFLAESNEGYHMLLYENTTDMPYQVAATAWTQLLGCKEVNDKTWDALRAFSARYIDQGPEKVP